MDSKPPSSTAGGDVGISFKDREADTVLFESLSEDEAGDAGANDEDVYLRWLTVGKQDRGPGFRFG